MEQNKSEVYKKSIPGGYDLKTDAVEALASAQKGNVPNYSKEELERYRKKKKWNIPQWLKVIAVKAWFAGAVAFFFLWGLGNYIGGLDMLFVTAVALGMVTDLLTNNVIRFVERYPGESDQWMMILPKGVKSFFLNLVYMGVVLTCVYLFYSVLNYSLVTISGNQDLYVGVEPLLFGLLCMGFDMLFIGMKHLIIGMVEDAKEAARRGGK